jgi:hypothetical protein
VNYNYNILFNEIKTETLQKNNIEMSSFFGMIRKPLLGPIV